MNRETAMRARESMSVPVSRKATSRAYLRRVLRVNLSDDTLSLNLVVDHVEDHATRPDREPSIPCLGTVLPLLKIQILKYKNAILRSPINKLLRSAIAEILSSTRTLDPKPFEGSNNTSSIFSLCLPLSKPSLKSLDRFRSALVLDFPIQTAYEKLVAICINSHDSISLVEIDSDRVNSFNIRKFDGVSNITDELISKILDYNAIDLSCVAEFFLERLWNIKRKMLSAIDCRNAQKAVLRDAGISTSLSDKEKSKRSMPTEGMIQVVPVLLGSDVSTSSEPDARTSKLTGYRSFDIAVDSSMQIKSFEMFAEIPGSLGYVAYLNKAVECFDERFIILNDYLQGSLCKHQLGDATMKINTLQIGGGV